MKVTTPMHPFELSECGIAPFRFIGVEHRVGPIRTVCPQTGLTLEIGSPGQPMGTCQHCGAGIAECCIIQDATGKRFVVGNVCVWKTADAKLIDPAKREIARLRTDARHEREHLTILAAKTALQHPAIRERLAALPHPMGFTDRATGRALTKLDWAEWMMANSGTAGRLKVAKAIR